MYGIVELRYSYYVKYIFEVRIKEGHTVEEYVNAWRKGSAVIQQMEGARGTNLLRKIGEKDTLLAIAEWESKEARDTAMAELEKTDPETQKILHAHRKFGEFKKIGAYDETEWSVMPKNMNNIYIGEGNLVGKGVYANRDFKEGDVIIKYNLKPLTKEEYLKLPESEKMFTHIHNGQIFLYSKPERYVNHSDNPNTYQDLEGKCDIALRDIKRGEMITTDATKDDV